MFPALALLLLFPLAALRLSRQAGLGPAEPWPRAALRVSGLFAVGLLIASPFLTNRGVGTGEAYNYSLAVADAVTQMRAGELPPVIGQTEFAFNGRVHPLRTAPYLFFLARGLDVVTGGSLTFWELQNLSLAFSLVAFVFATYGALRWGAGSDRATSVLLTVVAACCPALLTAGTVNLFMTLHAAPFLPLAAGACLRQARQPAVRSDFIMAAALGLAWLAHPPVALWTTVALAPVRLVLLWGHPVWQARYGLLAALALAAALAGFVVVSSSELVGGLDTLSASAGIHRDYVTQILGNLRAAFPGGLLPASRLGNTLADFQLGYTLWILVGAAAGSAARRLRWGLPADAMGRALATATAGFLLLLVLALPVPGLSAGLWDLVPTAAMNITNIWPQQRLYLVAAVLAVLVAGMRWPGLAWATWAAGRGPRLLLGAALFWSIIQTVPFLHRGFADRWSEADSRNAHLSSNLDLTITSYAYLRPPATFVHGVRDPAFEFRFLRSDQTEAGSNLAAGRATGTQVAAGQLTLGMTPGTGLTAIGSRPLELLPGKKYLLTLRFARPDFAGHLAIQGTALRRRYNLQNPDGPRGFGAGSGQEHSVPVWSSLPAGESAALSIDSGGWPEGFAVGAVVAEFELQEVDLERLPVRVTSLVPLQLRVNAPEENLTLVTPRAFLAGYHAMVNQSAVTPARSGDGQVAIPLRGKAAEVVLTHPGSRALHGWFWTSVVACAGLVAWAAAGLAGIDERRIAALLREDLLVPIRWSWRHPRLVVGGALAVGVLTLVAVNRRHYWESFGPIRIRFLIPPGTPLTNEPILSTGRAQAGTVVTIQDAEDGRIRVGAEIWGSLLVSEPIAVDRSQVQEIVVSSSALYPLDHPRAGQLSLSDQVALRGEFRVELNGRLALRALRNAFESTVGDVRVGRNAIGSSHAAPVFRGRILEVTRLALPATKVLGTGRAAFKLELTLNAAPVGLSEPLVAFGLNGEDGLLAATRLEGNRLRLTHFGSDGTEVAAQDLPFLTGRAHTLEVLPFSTPGGRGLGFTARLDGEPVFGLPDQPRLERPVMAITAVNRAGVPGVDPHLMTGTVRWPAGDFATELPAGSGSLRMQVMFPRDPGLRSEPLVTTGVTGKGDFAFVRYLGDQSIRFGVDHWGVGGAMSDPITIDSSRPHEIEISLGSFHPAENDPAWGEIPLDVRRARRTNMVIRFDGREVLRAPFAAHPAPAASVSIGANRIGGSSTEATFTGQILETGWLGSLR
jgi:hypothetical protein